MASVEDVFQILAEMGARTISKYWSSENKMRYWTYRNDTVWELFRQLDISEDDLNSLNIIHVAGSKGKGSTCTLIESILRENGMKTGLFLSPHVMKITERICIDGKPIDDEKFLNLFRTLWSEKSQCICDQYGLPPYFLVFFCMAIRAFIDEGVEVAIIEVGRGGEYDSTNIISKPIVCAIALLEIEHVKSLGDDIESIAWHKSGIFKSGSKAFSIPQHESAMAVLISRAKERKCDLKVVPKLSHYIKEWNQSIEIGLKGKFQSINASMAIEVCLEWMRKMGRIESENEDPEDLPDKTIDAFISGLKKASMTGRFQIIERPASTYYIDFAHTRASVRNAVEWFEECCIQKEKKIQGNIFRILVLYMVGKDLETIFPILQKIPYDRVVFPVGCLVNDDGISYNGDNTDRIQQFSRSVAETWKILDPERKEESYKMFGNINEAVAWIAAGRDEEVYSRAVEFLDGDFHDGAVMKMDHLQVFVPGSFGLIRGFLHLLSE